MRGAFLAEWTTLRRPRFLAGTLGAVCGVAALGTVLTILAVGGKDVGGTERTAAALARPAGMVQGLAAVSPLLGVVALAVAAAALAGEYGHGTMRNLLIAQPRRLVLLSGIFLALVTFIVAMVIAASVVAVGLAFALAPAKGVNVGAAWLTPDGLAALGRGIANASVAAVGYGTLGALLAVVLRSPAASISVGLAWALPVEGLMSRVWTPAGQWLPGQLLDALAAGGDGATVSYSAAGLRLAGYCLMAVTLAGVLFQRRDVTS